MKILAVDTSSKLCSVAILEDKNLIKKLELDNGLTHSETLMPLIQQLLNKCSLSLNNINLLVSDIGPVLLQELELVFHLVRLFQTV